MPTLGRKRRSCAASLNPWPAGLGEACHGARSGKVWCSPSSHRFSRQLARMKQPSNRSRPRIAALERPYGRCMSLSLRTIAVGGAVLAVILLHVSRSSKVAELVVDFVFLGFFRMVGVRTLASRQIVV
jgi:hypothetical protein